MNRLVTTKSDNKIKQRLNILNTQILYTRHIIASYSTAQFKLDTRMQVTILRDTRKQQENNVCMYNVTCCIAHEQQHMCSLSSCASPPSNPAHAQYTRYKHLNCLNHGQCTFLIQPQQQSIDSQLWCLLLMVSVSIKLQNTCSQNTQFQSFQDDSSMYNIWFASSCSISGVK